MGLLSIEQAMADYANLIADTRTKYKCPHCPVVAGGGSVCARTPAFYDFLLPPLTSLAGQYSGKLAAYMRLKYPTIVDMALAASAPVFLDSPGFGVESVHRVFWAVARV